MRSGAALTIGVSRSTIASLRRSRPGPALHDGANCAIQDTYEAGLFEAVVRALKPTHPQ